MKEIRKLFNKYYFLIPVLVYILVYTQTLGYKLAWQDDSLLIQPAAKDLHLVLKGFYENLPGHHFVPFYYLQSYLINLIFGENAFPFGFRLYGFLLHILSCVLLAVIVFKLTGNRLISVLIPLLWTVHPVNVETLTRVGMVPFQLASGTFCLAFTYCFLRIREVSTFRTRLIFSLLGTFFLLVSVTSCEQYLFFPIVLCLIFYLPEGKKLFLQKEYLYFFILPVTLIIPFYLGWRFLASGSSMYYAGTELIPWNEPGTLKDHVFRGFWLSPQLLVHYFRLFIWPDYLAESKADWYMVGGSLWSPYSLFCQLLIFGLILLGVYLYKKIPIFSIGVVWFLVSMVLVIQVVPLFTIVDEHYCYISVIGILLSIFSLVNYCREKISSKILVILIVPILCLLAWRTLLYVPSAKDRFSQVLSIVEYSPPWTKIIYMVEAIEFANNENKQSELPKWLNLTNLKYEVKEWVKKYLHEKVDLSYKFGPMQTIYKYNNYRFICRCLYYSNRPSELHFLMKQALEVKNNSFGWLQIAELFVEMKSWHEAWQALKKAIELNPRFQFSYGRSFVLIAQNSDNFNEAEKLVKNYIRLNSGSSYPYLFAGLFYLAFDKEKEALKYFAYGVSQDKVVSVSYKNAYFSALETFIKGNRFDLVSKTLKIVKKIAPTDPRSGQIFDMVLRKKLNSK